jgi:cell pole-organizing protein PopZ
MSRAESSEASIEEILASIRKTFNEDPPAPPQPVQASSIPAAATDPRPSNPRPSDVRPGALPSFRSVADPAPDQAAPLPTPPRSRAAVIDADLDDLIDAPAPKVGELKIPTSAAPAPVAGRTPSPAPPTSPIEAAREKWANLLNPNAAAPKPAETPPAATAEPASPTATQPAPASPGPEPAAPPVATPAAGAFGGLFAPRKGGFYPPQEPRPDPVLPDPASMAPQRAAETPAAKPAEPAPVLSASQPAAPSSPTRAGFVPFWQSGAAAAPAVPPAPAPSAVAPPPAAAKADPLPPPAAEVPAAASARVLDDLVAELNGSAVPAAAQAEPKAAESAPPVSAPPAAPVETLAAKALAAAAAAPRAPSPEIRAPEIKAPEVKAPAPASTETAAPVAKVAETKPSDAKPVEPAASNRSFEEVVADMLRPLLEKWIDENMPRIVERALQRDATLGRKPNN